MSELREPKLQIVSGMVGVGKTFQTTKELMAFIAGNKRVGRSPRKVLAFDPNNRDYKNFDTLHYDVSVKGPIERTKDLRVFTAQKKVEGRRIVALRKDGEPMSPDEKLICFKDILTYFKNGVVVIEDINNYVTNFDSDFIVGAITTYRHRNTDIIMHVQSIGALRPRLWQACKILRMHHETDDASRMKDRLGDRYTVVKIAQIIIKKKYKSGDKRFFLYIDMELQQIHGRYTKAEFLEACNTYLNENRAEYIALVYEFSENMSASNKTKAKQRWIDDNMALMGSTI